MNYSERFDRREAVLPSDEKNIPQEDCRYPEDLICQTRLGLPGVLRHPDCRGKVLNGYLSPDESVRVAEDLRLYPYDVVFIFVPCGNVHVRFALEREVSPQAVRWHFAGGPESQTLFPGPGTARQALMTKLATQACGRKRPSFRG